MIRLTSQPTQQALTRLFGCAEQASAAEQAGEPIPDAVASCYRHSDVKAAIVAETNEKCAYCEAKVRHISYGDVEHIKPKGRFQELALSYDNLTLACSICNNLKGTYYNAEQPILNPYEDEPADHLVGVGSLVWHLNGSALGQRTVDLLALNREALCERRYERIRGLSSLADRYAMAPDGEIKEALAEQLRIEVADSSEFALVVRSFLWATHGVLWNEM